MPSGAELALVTLVTAMKDYVTPHVILFECGPLTHKLERAGVSFEVMPTNRRLRDLPANRAGLFLSTLCVAPLTAWYVLLLYMRLRHLRPDLVHINSLKAGLVGGMAAKFAGVPVVWHMRDRIDNYAVSPFVKRSICSLVTRVASGVIANSAGTLATLSRSERDFPTAVIPSAIDIRRRPKETSQPFTFAMVGRLSRWKGQDVFLRAFAEVVAVSDCRAIVVGDALFGPADRKFALELVGLCEELGISKSVEFRGHQDDVAAELASADALVHASVLPEPFGQVVVQGMAVGVPVIAAAAGGPLEVVRDNENGLLHPPGSVAGLASGMLRLREDGELRQRLCSQGLITARQFTPAETAARTARFYDEVVTIQVFPRRVAPSRHRHPRSSSSRL
jgi:glycosyltransferase involved in cell wall biosynthesis